VEAARRLGEAAFFSLAELLGELVGPDGDGAALASSQ
jgi:hypothetical protein